MVQGVLFKIEPLKVVKMTINWQTGYSYYLYPTLYKNIFIAINDIDGHRKLYKRSFEHFGFEIESVYQQIYSFKDID